MTVGDLVRVHRVAVRADKQNSQSSQNIDAPFRRIFIGILELESLHKDNKLTPKDINDIESFRDRLSRLYDKATHKGV